MRTIQPELLLGAHHQFPVLSMQERVLFPFPAMCRHHQLHIVQAILRTQALLKTTQLEVEAITDQAAVLGQNLWLRVMFTDLIQQTRFKVQWTISHSLRNKNSHPHSSNIRINHIERNLRDTIHVLDNRNNISNRKQLLRNTNYMRRSLVWNEQVGRILF